MQNFRTHANPNQDTPKQTQRPKNLLEMSKKPCGGQLRTVVENLPKENQDPMVFLKIQNEDQIMFLLALKQWFSKYVQGCKKFFHNNSKMLLSFSLSFSHE